MGASTPTWALITVSYNSAAALREFWGSVQLPSSVQWVVVDNASTDDSREVAAELGATVIPLDSNIGFGPANNVGFRATTAPYVGFVNPDVSVDVPSLDLLRRVIDRERAIVSPQLVDPDGGLQPNGRGFPFLASKITNRLEANDRGSGYRRFAPSGQDVRVVWFMGAVVLGSRPVLQRLGPWDERFFVYYEDSDLGLRAAAAGVPRILSGRTRWVHGWARETTRFDWKPWKRELPSMMKFYSRYPVLLSPFPRRTSRRLARMGWPKR